MIEEIILTGTSDATGDVTLTASQGVIGMLYAVEWVDGDLADNNTAVLSVTETPSGVDQVLLTLGAGEGDADIWYYPRTLADDLGAAALAATYTYPLINGTLELVIASGGNAKTGGAYVYVLID